MSAVLDTFASVWYSVKGANTVLILRASGKTWLLGKMKRPASLLLAVLSFHLAKGHQMSHSRPIGPALAPSKRNL